MAKLKCDLREHAKKSTIQIKYSNNYGTFYTVEIIDIMNTKENVRENHSRLCSVIRSAIIDLYLP